MKEENNITVKDGQGIGYVLVYGVAFDQTTRTFFAHSFLEIQNKIDEFKDKEYIGIDSIIEVNNYWKVN